MHRSARTLPSATSGPLQPSATSGALLPNATSARPQRRDLLRGAAALAVLAPALTGCDLDPGPPPPPDPLTDFHRATLALAARYDAAGTATPLLPLIRDAHRAHAAALAAIMRPAPSPAASPATGTAPTVADLRKEEQAAQLEAAKLCLAAGPDRTTLLGEIAAARAAHLEALR